MVIVASQRSATFDRSDLSHVARVLHVFVLCLIRVSAAILAYLGCLGYLALYSLLCWIVRAVQQKVTQQHGSSFLLSSFFPEGIHLPSQEGGYREVSPVHFGVGS